MNNKVNHIFNVVLVRVIIFLFYLVGSLVLFTWFFDLISAANTILVVLGFVLLILYSGFSVFVVKSYFFRRIK